MPLPSRRCRHTSRERSFGFTTPAQVRFSVYLVCLYVWYRLYTYATRIRVHMCRNMRLGVSCVCIHLHHV